MHVRVPRHLFLACALAASFALGLSLSPAEAAGSHPGAWGLVFGHDTSCALGRASTNDATERGGGVTANFRGCDASNARRSVPPRYLQTRAFIVNHASGEVCGDSGWRTHSATASSIDASTPRERYTPGCEAPNKYSGYSYSVRVTDAGKKYLRARSAGAYWFPSWLA